MVTAEDFKISNNEESFCARAYSVIFNPVKNNRVENGGVENAEMTLLITCDVGTEILAAHA